MTKKMPRTSLTLLLVALLALPVVLSAPRDAEAGAPGLTWTYRNKEHKFSLKMFKGFEPVPQKIGEKTVVCEFRDPKSKGQARGTFDAAIEVVRYSPEGKEDGPVVTGGEGPMTPERMRELIEARNKPKNIWDATVANLRIDPKERKRLEVIKQDFKEIESKDKPKIPGRLWEFELRLASYRGTVGMHVCLAEFERDGMATGIFMRCGEPLKKSYAKSFVRIAKSFKWKDSKAKDVETLKVLEGVNITAKKRRQIEKSLVSTWDVIVSPKKNYIVLYNTKNGKNHQLAKIIAKRIELIREQIYEVQFPPAHPIETVCIVRVCEDRKEYRAYGGPDGSAGYWSPMAEELVFYDASPGRKADRDTLAVLYHEAFHQYIHYSVGRVAPHSWFNEGHGDYYAGAEYKSGKFKIKPFQWRVGVIKNAIVQGERTREEATDDKGNTSVQWGRSGFTPLEHLVKFTQREYYSYPSVSYAQGWSLIYFLREIVPNNRTYNEKWGHILELYFNTLKAEVNKDGSLDREREKRKKEAEEEEEADDEGDDATEDGKKDDGTPDPAGKPGGNGADEPPAPDGGDGDGDKDDEASTNEAPRTIFQGAGGPEALKKAVEVAFEGVDWEELQEAWLRGTKKGK